MQDGEERQPTYQQGDDGHGTVPSFLMATAYEQQPVYQRQANDDQGDGLSRDPMEIVGQAREISCPIPDLEEMSGLNTREQPPVCQQSDVLRNDLNQSLLNGGEVVPRQESLSIQEPGTCQLVNGQQQQPRYHLSAQGNVPSYPTQEMGLNGSQTRDRQEVRHPIQETGPSSERMQDEHEDQPPGHPHLNGAGINGVSSTGEREQAAEHNCSRQELQLWKQELYRQADVTLSNYDLSVINTFSTILKHFVFARLFCGSYKSM